MPAKAGEFTADFFYIDNEGYEGHVQVYGSDEDILFARLDTVREKAKNRGFKPREFKKPTYVTNKYTPRTPAAKTAVDAAVEVLGGKPAQECSVCNTEMVFEKTMPFPDGTMPKARTGRFAGQDLPDKMRCPKCQKVSWLARTKEEIPF